MKRFVSILVVLSIVAVPLLMTAEDAGSACVQAQADAQRDVSGTLWFFAGCVFGILGVGAAYIIEPSPSAMGLLGKSPEYVAVYTDCYKDAGRKVQTSKAITGCLVWAAVDALLATIYILSGGFY